jgi:hypothetical protein
MWLEASGKGSDGPEYNCINDAQVSVLPSYRRRAQTAGKPKIGNPADQHRGDGERPDGSARRRAGLGARFMLVFLFPEVSDVISGRASLH